MKNFRILSKKDHLGRDTPSNIPSPNSGFRPKVGLPPTIDGNTTRTINSIGIDTELEEYLKQTSADVNRLILDYQNSLTDVIESEDYVSMADRLTIPSDLRTRIRDTNIEFVNGRMASVWQASLVAGSETVRRKLSRDAGRQIRFDEAAERMSKWTSEHSLEFATNMTNQQVESIRQSIQKVVVEQGKGSRSLAKVIEQTAGLTKRQAGAVINLREQLSKDGASEEVIDKQAARYTEKLKRVRAKRIARTESALAFNFGGFQQMKEASSSGDLDGVVVKRFYTALDERVCPVCGRLHGVVIPMDETFPTGSKTIPNIFVPPLHPNCRCRVIYEVIEVSDELPEARPDDLVAGVNLNESPIVPPTIVDPSAVDFDDLMIQVKADAHAVAAGDQLATAFGEVQGFNGLPHVVNGDQLDSFIARGEQELFRAMQDPDDRYFKDFTEGDLYYGFGNYGSGIYSALGKKTGVGDATFHARLGASEAGVSNPRIRVMRMALKHDARTISFAEARRRQAQELKTVMSTLKHVEDKGAVLSKDNRLWYLLGNGSEWAMAHGYDAMIADDLSSMFGSKSVVVLNRSAVRVENKYHTEQDLKEPDSVVQ